MNFNNLVSNRWYPDFKPGSKAKSPYPTPQSILRNSLGTTEYSFKSQTVDCDFIKAAVIMPLGLSFSHLLNEPWVLSFCGPSWRMLICSTDTPDRWIELCKASGAIAWQKASTKSYTYTWEAPPLDEWGMVIRPPNAMGITKPGPHSGVQKKSYDKEALLADVRLGLMTHTEIGELHGLSRITVMKLAKDAGIRQRAPHHGQTKI